MSFIFGGNTGETAESLRRKRAYAESMMQGGPQIRDAASGLHYAGSQIAGALLARHAGKKEKAAQAEAMKRWESVFGGAAKAPEASPAPIVEQPLPPKGDIYSAIEQVESGGNPNAVSPVGATGAMQIMPETARDPGYGVPNIFEVAKSAGLPVPDQSDETLNALLRNPDVNRAFGRKYYDAMLKNSGGDRELALASYNAGPGAVQQYGGIPPFQETQDYVQRVNSRMGPQTVSAAMQAAPQAQQQQPSLDIAMLARLAGDEFLPEAQRSVAQAMLARMMTPPEQMSPYQQERLALDRQKLAAQMSGQIGGGPVVNVNTGQPQMPQPEIGTIPQGYQAVWDAKANSYTMQPIPGGPAAAEIASADAKGEMRKEQDARYGAVVLDDIGRVRQLVETARLPTTGAVGGLLSNIGGTAARDVRGLIDTIGANVGFDRLTAMRASSPTGGALGSVTERELALLKATLGNLEQDQSQEQFLSNLSRLEQIYQGIMQKAEAYPNASEFGFAPEHPQANMGAVRSAGVGADDPAPEGIDPDDWEFLTPQERALFR